MLTFFNNVADDLGHTILNLQEVRIVTRFIIMKKIKVALQQ